jgi:hypothetical protein
MEFITNHWASILVVVAFIVVAVILSARGKKQIVYKMLYTLVSEAEERYGSGEGAAKFAEVMTRIYTMLPAIIRIFITYETLEKWIEDALVKAKADWAKKAGIEPETPTIVKGFSE